MPPRRGARARLLTPLVLCALAACDRAPEPADRAPARASAGSRPSERSAAEPAPEAATASPDPEPPDPLGPVRLDLDLSSRLVLRVAELDPHLDAVRLDARTIRIEARTADVTALEALCTAEPAHCEDALDAWAARLARPVETATARSLAAVLVPRVEVEAARASARAAGLPEPIVGRPWVEPFFLAIVDVEPDVLRQLEPPDLVALGGLDVPAMERLALRNLESDLLAEERASLDHAPASIEHAPRVRVVRTDDGLSTSRLLLLDRWRALAGADGPVVAAAPTAHALLFTTSVAPLDVATLAYLARRMFAAESAPVSPALLRLTTAGWVLESSNDRPDPERDAALAAVYAGGTAED